MSIAAPLTMTPSTGCSLFNKYGLWYNKHPFSMVFVTRREKKGNRADVKEYLYTVKRGLTIAPEDLKLSRKVFNHILSKHRKPSFQHINMNLDNKVAVIGSITCGIVTQSAYCRLTLTSLGIWHSLKDSNGQ